MALYLRKINKPKWEPGIEAALLIEKSDIPADNLSDIRTENNELSVWKVSEDRSNMMSIVAACATTFQYFTNFDYAIFDHLQLESAGLAAVDSPGETNDKEANEKWHADVVNLTGKSLVSFGLLLFSANRFRIQKSEAKRAVVESISKGRFRVEDMHEKLREETRELVDKDIGGGH